MTYEEALEEFNSKDYNGYSTRANGLIKAALMKQIQKKPKKDTFINLCPQCGREEIECELYDCGTETKFEFCPHCGQAIDWSDE